MSSDGISGVGNNPYLYYAMPVNSTQSVASDGQEGTDAFQSRVQARLAMQNHRIEDGVQSGRLTQDQAAQLYDMENNIQSSFQSLESSGNATFQDQHQLLDTINQASAQIFLAQHPEIASALGQTGVGSTAVNSQTSDSTSGTGLDLTSLAQQLEGNSALTDDDKQRLTNLLTHISGRMRGDNQTGADASGQTADTATSGTDLASLAQQLQSDSTLSDDDKQRLAGIMGQVSGNMIFAHQLESARASQGQDLIGLAQQLDSDTSLSNDDKQRLTDLLTRISQRLRGDSSQATVGQGATASDQTASAGSLTSLAQQLENDPTLSDADKLGLENILGRAGGRMQFANLMAQAQTGQSEQTASASTASQIDSTASAASPIDTATSTSSASSASGTSGAGGGGGASSSSDQLASLEQEQAQLQQELATAQADPSATSEQIASLEGSLEQVTAQIAQIQGTSQSS